MSAQKSFSKKETKKKKENHEVPWYQRVDYMVLIKKSALILWENKKRLIVIGILLTLTGGQAITFNSSFSFNYDNSGNNKIFQDFNKKNEGDENWQKTLDQIENREVFKTKIREFISNKDKVFLAISIAAILFFLVVGILIALFILNCYFHLIYLKTISSIDLGIKKDKIAIKKEVRGEWKNLALLRIIFGLIYFAIVMLFLLPVSMFALQKSWLAMGAFLGIAIIGILTALVFTSYVFRYSFFYLAQSRISIKESIDRGYELFALNWKESFLSSLVNFAVGIVAFLASMALTFILMLPFALLAGVFGLILQIVLGQAHATGVWIGVASVFLFVPFIIVVIILASFWQMFVINFWLFFFKEIAGKRISAEEAKELSPKKKKIPEPVVEAEKLK